MRFSSLTIFLLFFTPSIYAQNDSSVFAITVAQSESGRNAYGFSGFDTKGKGTWGLYGELLFTSDDEKFNYCDPACQEILVEEEVLSLTVGTTYGLTENLYGLLGAGVRYYASLSAPAYNSSVCDEDDEEPAAHSSDGSQYCRSDHKINAVGQIGLLYVTPIGFSLAATYASDKTLALSLGYQF